MIKETRETKSQIARGTLAAAEILALLAGVDVIPAPGAGLFNHVTRITLIMKAGTVQYTVVGVTDLDVQYKGSNISILDIDGIIEIAANATHARLDSPAATALATIANIENRAIELKSAGASPLAGNGTLEYEIEYRTVRITPDFDLR